MELRLPVNYYLTEYWKNNSNPTTEGWPLMSNGPGKLLVLIMCYIVFSTGGPIVMKSRKPFDCRTAMIVHNCLLILINGYFFIVGLASTKWGSQTWQCGLPVTQKDEELFATCGYWYMITKILDFGDTIFLVLRKKGNQLSFLHISHHALMPFPLWLAIHWEKSHYLVFWTLVNTFIHTVMYTYYLMARFEEWSKVRLRWKKRITQMQMIQFLLVFCHSIRGFLDKKCRVPRTFLFMELAMSIYFFVMFGHFYVKAYRKRTETRQKQKAM